MRLSTDLVVLWREEYESLNPSQSSAEYDGNLWPELGSTPLMDFKKKRWAEKMSW